jgi:hypothetical protein
MNEPDFDINEDGGDGNSPIVDLVYEVNLQGDLSNYMDVYIPVLKAFMKKNPSAETIAEAIKVTNQCISGYPSPTHATRVALQKVLTILESGGDEDPQGGARRRKGKKSRKVKKTRKSKKSRKVKKMRKTKKSRRENL